MERAWILRGFGGVAALSRTPAGRLMCELGRLASGADVVSLRGEIDSRTAVVRYLSDGRRFARPLQPSITERCDAVWAAGGFEGLKLIYAADLLARGESKLIMCQRDDDDDEVLALADVVGSKLVCTFYAAAAGRSQVRV